MSNNRTVASELYTNCGHCGITARCDTVYFVFVLMEKKSENNDQQVRTSIISNKNKELRFVLNLGLRQGSQLSSEENVTLNLVRNLPRSSINRFR